MKRRISLFLCMLSVCCMLSGCGSKSAGSSAAADSEEEIESLHPEFAAYGLRPEHPRTLTQSDVTDGVPADAVYKHTYINEGFSQIEYRNVHDDPLTKYELNSDGEPKDITCCEYEYNDKGQKVWKYELADWGALGFKEEECFYEYSCELTDEPTIIAHYNDGLLSFILLFFYDDFGNMVGSYTEHYDKTAAEEGKREIVLKSNDCYSDCEYDADGNLLSYCERNKDGILRSTTSCTYDAAGNCVRTEKVNEGWEDSDYRCYKEVHVMAFDDAGHTVYDEETDWETPEKIRGVYKYEREYDSEGRLTRVIHTYDNGETEISEYTYEPL
ncbi:MAG: hypothetical protein IKQ39_03370 [Oscillospiraceae bacterium]|nr:hypothetical protein [Oscillospiraceae bacterium]